MGRTQSATWLGLVLRAVGAVVALYSLWGLAYVVWAFPAAVLRGESLLDHLSFLVVLLPMGLGLCYSIWVGYHLFRKPAARWLRHLCIILAVVVLIVVPTLLELLRPFPGTLDEEMWREICLLIGFTAALVTYPLSARWLLSRVPLDGPRSCDAEVHLPKWLIGLYAFWVWGTFGPILFEIRRQASEAAADPFGSRQAVVFLVPIALALIAYELGVMAFGPKASPDAKPATSG